MKIILKKRWLFFYLTLIFMFVGLSSCSNLLQEKIGVLYVLHGGQETNDPRYMWDASIQMFLYDQNHPVYKFVIWDAEAWPTVLDSEVTEFAVRFLRKYEFEYERIGGFDPFHQISDRQFEDLKKALKNNIYGIKFEFEWAGWIAGQHTDHFPYPRFLLMPPTEGGDPVTYCGEREKADGPWENCNPDRYDVDGPIERLLKKGVTKIIMIDTAVGGVRFYKPFDVYQMSKKVLNKWNAEHETSIPMIWVNDINNFMEMSYPVEPEGWTASSGKPTSDPSPLLTENPNPLIEDPALALLHAEGIEAAMSETVEDNLTGVVLFNHGLFDEDRRFFDPKIDDTTLLNENIKSILIKRHPDINPDNIIGAYGGSKTLNPVNNVVELTRDMRGENLAQAYPHEADNEISGHPWGYRYWKALDYLKNRGVKHIVIAFPQVVTYSVLNVELSNQIAKEIGVKNWAKWGVWDFEKYPEVGHPFTDFWGNWVNTDCGGKECCFEMGGCSDGRPYPPPRQAPFDKPRGDLDPSLAFDNSDYGHLGYDPILGAPNPNKPVQNQYTGTWELYDPPNDDPRLGQLLAKHVLEVATANQIAK